MRPYNPALNTAATLDELADHYPYSAHEFPQPGNWKRFSDFCWSRARDIPDADSWAIWYTHNRDSTLLDESNADAIAAALAPYLDVDCDCPAARQIDGGGDCHPKRRSSPKRRQSAATPLALTCTSRATRAAVHSSSATRKTACTWASNSPPCAGQKENAP